MEDHLTYVDVLIRRMLIGRCASSGILLCWLGTSTVRRSWLSFCGSSPVNGFGIRLSFKILIGLIDDRLLRLFSTFRISL